MKAKLVFILSFLVSVWAWGQESAMLPVALDSVFLQTTSQVNALKAANLEKLSDIDTTNDFNPVSLSGLLQDKTNLFIREYGRGMLSGISIRGTGVSHTQVVWNGIPVNSVLNGQTDLNTFYISDFNKNIIVKKGGGSVSFGSGAIGGVVLYNNPIHYINTFKLDNSLSLGSFKTMMNHTRVSVANHMFFNNLEFVSHQSDNDYPYVGYAVKNENAAYHGTGFSWTSGYKINKKHQIYFKTKLNHLDREMSRTLYKPDQAKLWTNNHRNLLGWQYASKRFTATTDFAYLYESYQYFFNKNRSENTRSLSNVYMIKNQLSWLFSKQKSLLIGNNFSYEFASGEHIEHNSRKMYALYAIWTHKIKDFQYFVKLRKGFSNRYKIPLIGAVEAVYDMPHKHQIRFNASTNYRLPTFNDLYWNPGGNSRLYPEKSYQTEFSYQKRFDGQNHYLQFNITGFFIHSDDLIKWTPDNNQYWSPKNFESVSHKGIEIAFDSQASLWDKIQFSTLIHYTYQQVKDLKTNKLIPYTPMQTGSAEIRLHYKKLRLAYTNHFQGKIFTTTSNTLFMKATDIHNVSLQFQINKHFGLEGSVQNLLNTYYESFPTRPLPGRNYQININYKIS